jgi:hypothetical protein
MARLLGFSGPIGGQRECRPKATWRRERNCPQTLSVRVFNELQTTHAMVDIAWRILRLLWRFPIPRVSAGLRSGLRAATDVPASATPQRGPTIVVGQPTISEPGGDLHSARSNSRYPILTLSFFGQRWAGFRKAGERRLDVLHLLLGELLEPQQAVARPSVDPDEFIELELKRLCVAVSGCPGSGIP